jgi:hypothetical protein
MITAEGIHQSVKQELELNHNGFGHMHAVTILLHSIRYLKNARNVGELELSLAEPLTSIDAKWDTLIACAIKYQLRKDGIVLSNPPTWLKKAPLEQMWWPIARSPRKATNSFNTTPPELRQVGIFLAEQSFQ